MGGLAVTGLRRLGTEPQKLLAFMFDRIAVLPQYACQREYTVPMITAGSRRPSSGRPPAQGAHVSFGFMPTGRLCSGERLRVSRSSYMNYLDK